MDSLMKISVVLMAVDKMSSVINDAASKSIKKLNDVSDKANKLGRDLGAMGAGGAAALALPVKAFMDLEEAQTRLKSVMMGVGGVIDQGMFSKMDAEAIKLGNELPGTTADFYKMFETLVNGGVSAKSIIDGTGRSAAYLAIQLKIPYEEAAISAAKLKQATGMADDKMMDFMDTIARMKQFNVSSTEMEYAFGRSAGTLKTLGIQGLDASKKMGTLFAMMIQGGLSGETVGTGMTAVLNSLYDAKKMKAFNAEAAKVGMSFDFVDKKSGTFKGVENMVAQFDKIKALNPQQASNLINALTGGGQDANMVKILVDNGVKGFNKYQNAMQKQATLSKKVELQMKTTAAQWEAATGTFMNSMAKVGAKLAPILISLIGKLNSLSGMISRFVDKHPGITKMIVAVIAGFTMLSLAGSGLSFMFGGVTKAASMLVTGFRFFVPTNAVAAGSFTSLGAVIKTVSTAMKANPITAILMAIITIAMLVYEYWEPIKKFFIKLWDGIKKVFMAIWDYIKDWPFIKQARMIYENWDKIKAFFVKLWAAVKKPFVDFYNWAKDTAIKHVMWLMEKWRAIKGFFIAVWEAIKKPFVDFYEWGKDIAMRQVLWLMEKWNTIKQFFIDAWEKVKAPFVKFYDWIVGTAQKPVKSVTDAWGRIKKYFTDLWNGVKQKFIDFVDWIKGIPKRMYDAGVNMVSSLWKGIKDYAMKPVNEIKKMVANMRDYFPFSPAKVGPLRDIHKVRLVETIADSIKPAPMVKAMRAATAATMLATQPMAAKMPTPINSVNAPAANPTTSKSSSVSVSYAPVITLKGGTEADKVSFGKMLKDHEKEIVKLIKESDRKNSRTEY